MKKSSSCLFYAVLIFTAPLFAQSDAEGSDFISAEIDFENSESLLSNELEDMIVWRLEENLRSGELNQNDDLLLERRELRIVKETAIQRLSSLEKENQRMEFSSLALAEENNRLLDAREKLIERINELVQDNEIEVAIDQEEWEVIEEESRQRLETIQILEQQLMAYDRELVRNEEIIHIQDGLINDNEEEIFLGEEEVSICEWLSDSDLELLRK